MQSQTSWFSLSQLCSVGILRKCSTTLIFSLSMKIQYFSPFFLPPIQDLFYQQRRKDSGTGTRSGHRMPCITRSPREGVAEINPLMFVRKKTYTTWKYSHQGGGKESTRCDNAARDETKEDTDSWVQDSFLPLNSYKVLLSNSIKKYVFLQLPHVGESKLSLLLASNHYNSGNDTKNLITF